MQSVCIPEYARKKIPHIDSSIDIPYLRKTCFGTDSKNPPFEVLELKDGKVEIRNTSYGGVIQLEDLRIEFSTKVKTNLFYMLSFLKDEDCFRYDPEVVIDLKEGQSFFDILGKMFLNELEEISRIGFYKKYVKKEEDVSFLKGKLKVKKQIQNNIHNRLKFFCAYDDLTYDNLENQIILRATTLLVPLIRVNETIRKNLIRYSHLLRGSISLIAVRPEDCDKVQYSKLNEHYETAIKFAKIILQYYFIRSTSFGESKGFNFIVNMNRVYEDFITEVVEDLVKNDPTFSGFVLEKQERFSSLVKERKIVTRPDILLRKIDTDEHVLILDAKYKRQDNNADYFQVIAYALALPNTKVCCLVYPSDENLESQRLTLDAGMFTKERGDILLRCERVDLHFDEDATFSGYVANVKGQLKTILQSALSESGVAA